jgi:hypothetical protein|tara:strand:- start:95 stop:250 length:156 start_codon:yes stop_codon:yes gene_type:complete
MLLLLLGRANDLNSLDADGETPLDLEGDGKTADLIRKHGDKTGEELEAAGN